MSRLMRQPRARLMCRGLPPTYISVGGLDLFLEENQAYADRLSRAGVPVEFHIYPRAYHGFYRVTSARVTKQAEHDTREGATTLPARVGLRFRPCCRRRANA